MILLFELIGSVHEWLMRRERRRYNANCYADASAADAQARARRIIGDSKGLRDAQI